MKERMTKNRNKRKIKCSRCNKDIFFYKEEIYQDDTARYINCTNCGHDTKLRKIK